MLKTPALPPIFNEFDIMTTLTSSQRTNLHKKFALLGKQRHNITYQLLAILPDIYKKSIYRDYGFPSIYEYAGKLAGLSHSVVEKTLKIERHLKNKPQLQRAIASQGIHKVAIVAKLATPKTDAAWADKVENMSKAGLQELSKEIRKNNGLGFTTSKETSIQMDEEMQFLFAKIKRQLCKKTKLNLSNKEAFKIMLKKLTDEGQPSHTNRTAKPHCRTKVKKIPGDFSRSKSNTSRYIPAQQKRTALKKTEQKCGFPGCNKLPDHFHHRIRFSEHKSHESIIPLCKTHHEIAHNGLIKNESGPPKTWRIEMIKHPTNHADLNVRKFKTLSKL